MGMHAMTFLAGMVCGAALWGAALVAIALDARTSNEPKSFRVRVGRVGGDPERVFHSAEGSRCGERFNCRGRG
jgi:uncharacterized low-complexity protein